MKNINSEFNKAVNAEQKHFYINMAASIVKDTITTVSFSIFDTLVVMPFFEQSDLFFLMEDEFSSLYTGKKSFYDLRKKAEETAKKKSDKNLLKISDIYDALEKLSGISHSSAEKLMQQELDLTVYYCYPRDCGMKLYREAIDAGKNVVLISDTYYPTETVTEILKHCTVTEYKGIFLSNSVQSDKTDAALYNAVVKKYGLKEGQLIHVGSDIHSDIEVPVAMGIEALYLPSCTESMKKSGFLFNYITDTLKSKFVSADYFSLRCVLALYSEYGFDYPSGPVRKQGDFCGSEKLLGFITLGAIGLIKDYVMSSQTEAMVITAMSRNHRISEGSDRLPEIFESHFGEFLNQFDFKGCNLPLRYYVEHGNVSDRMCLKNFISPKDFVQWGDSVKEYTPSGAKNKDSLMSGISEKVLRQGSLQKNIADKLIRKLKNL